MIARAAMKSNHVRNPTQWMVQSQSRAPFLNQASAQTKDQALALGLAHSLDKAQIQDPVRVLAIVLDQDLAKLKVI